MRNIGKLAGRFKSTINIIRESALFKIFWGILMVMAIGASTVYLFERSRNSEEFTSFFQSLWWALVTMTTVGYGDKVPVTVGGRVAGALIMFSGVALVSLFTATISSAYVAKRIREGKGLEKITFTNHIVLCGWHDQCGSIIKSLNHLMGTSNLRIVLVNELPEDEANNIVFEHKDVSIKYVHGDFTNENILDLANIRDAESVIIVPDSSTEGKGEPDERTVFATLTIKAVNPAVKVFAHVLNPETRGHLRRANVNDIVLQDEFSGYLLASHVANPGIPEAISELLDYNIRMNIQKVEIPEEYVGKTFGDLAVYFKNVEDWILIGIATDVPPVDISDVLSADPTSLDSFIERKFKESGLDLLEERGMRVKINPSDNLEIGETDGAIVIGGNHK